MIAKKTVFNEQAGRKTDVIRARRGLRHCGGAFTLIELLVVISIIALLASLTVGLSGLASRKSKEARVKGDLNRLATAIDNYKAAIGSYPRDNPGRPSTNQLFYELSGTYYVASAASGQFQIPGRSVSISAQAVTTYFRAPGFGNSVRRDAGEKLKFTEEFKPAQSKMVNANPPVEILIVPTKGPETFTYNGKVAPLPIRAADGTLINPWLYDSSSPNRNNRRGFDLWAEISIGKQVIRFSNWEKDPVVVGPGR